MWSWAERENKRKLLRSSKKDTLISSNRVEVKALVQRLDCPRGQRAAVLASTRAPVSGPGLASWTGPPVQVLDQGRSTQGGRQGEMAVEGVRERPAAASLGLHHQSLGLAHATGAFRLGLESDSAADNIRPQAWSDVRLGDVQQHWDDRPLDLNLRQDRAPGGGSALLQKASGSESWSSAWATSETARGEAADAAGARAGSLDPALRLASGTLSEVVRNTWAPPSASTPSSSGMAATAPHSFLLGHHGPGYAGLPMTFEPALSHGMPQALPGQQYSLPLAFPGQDYQGAAFNLNPQLPPRYGGEAPSSAAPRPGGAMQQTIPVNYTPPSFTPLGMGIGFPPMSYGMRQEYYQGGTASLAQQIENLDLNPMANEYVPPPVTGNGGRNGGRNGKRRGKGGQGERATVGQTAHQPARNNGQQSGGRGRGGGERSARGGRARGGRGRGGGGSQRNDASVVKRTIYIADIDSQVTEEQLAVHFQGCGTVFDCRVCGDPNSAMRFAFIEFTEEKAVSQALERTGSMLGERPLRVLRSRTAIVPVNNDLLPRDPMERELCIRTVYVANIDKRVERSDVHNFFQDLCGKVTQMRLLGDYQHPSRIAFVEFEHAESATAALNCSGALLGSLAIRVSPSKTPVRSERREDSLEHSNGNN